MRDREDFCVFVPLDGAVCVHKDGFVMYEDDCMCQ